MQAGQQADRRGDDKLMQVLSVLTPPLLVCGVVIAAIVAFLRHEMGRARTGRAAPDDEISAPGPAADGEDGAPDRHSEAAQAPGGDSQPRR